MPRFFVEVSYMGTRYSGFQKQKNANSIQGELEKALQIFYRSSFELTGSSRTDAGVHALCNYFHFDRDIDFLNVNKDFDKAVYNINAILPGDIVVKRIFQVKDDAHVRFDAVSREYKYFVYRVKDPFLQDRGYFFPYTIDKTKLDEAAAIIMGYDDFSSFSKKHTQVKTNICAIYKSEWQLLNNMLVYNVTGNRFLRGMVRGLTGTMLKVGTGKINIQEFIDIIEGKDATKADFSVPPQGLFLVSVNF